MAHPKQTSLADEKLWRVTINCIAPNSTIRSISFVVPGENIERAREEAGAKILDFPQWRNARITKIVQF